MNQHNLAFGMVLRAIRLERHQTQADLAFASGLDRTYVSLLELGSSSPTLDTMIAVCNALSVSLSSFTHNFEEAMDSRQRPENDERPAQRNKKE